MAKLNVELGVIDRLSKDVENINRNVSGFVDNVKKKFDVLTKGFVAIGAATGIAVGLKRMIDGANQIAESAEGAALKTNMTTTAVQQWDYALRQNKSSMDAAWKGFQKIQISAYDAQRGLKDAKDGFAALGVTVTNSNGSFKTTEQLSKEVIIALAGMEDKTARTAIATKLMGKGASELNPLLEQGAEGIKKLLGEADKYGQVLDQKTIKSITAANDAMDRFQRATGVMGARIISLVAGPIEKWVDGMFTIIEQVEKLKKSIFGMTNEEKGREVLEKYEADYKSLEKAIQSAGNAQAIMWGTDFITVENAKGKLDSLRISIAALNEELKEPSPPPPPAPVSGIGVKEKKLPDNFWSLGVDKALEGSKVMQGFVRDNVFYAQSVGSILSNFDVKNLGVSPAVAEENRKFQEDTQKEIDKAILDSKKSYGQLEIDYVDTKYAALLEKARAAGLETVQIEQMIADQKDAIWQQSVSNSLSYTTNNLRAVAEQWNVFTGLYKTAAIAQATMDTYSSAVSAYKAMVGIPVVGPFLGIAASGAAIAAGLANVQKIASINPRNMASGGMARGGMYRVGEHGPETAYLPDGARVYNATQTRNINNSRSSNITLHLTDVSGNITRTITRAVRADSSDELIRLIVDRVKGRVN